MSNESSPKLTVLKAKRRHNCAADSNKLMLSVVWRGDVLVTTWGCRRCHETWETIYDPKQAEAERIARLHQRVAEVAAQMREES